MPPKPPEDDKGWPTTATILIIVNAVMMATIIALARSVSAGGNRLTWASPMWMTARRQLRCQRNGGEDASTLDPEEGWLTTHRVAGSWVLVRVVVAE